MPFSSLATADSLLLLDTARRAPLLGGLVISVSVGELLRSMADKTRSVLAIKGWLTLSWSKLEWQEDDGRLFCLAEAEVGAELDKDDDTDDNMFSFKDML